MNQPISGNLNEAFSLLRECKFAFEVVLLALYLTFVLMQDFIDPFSTSSGLLFAVLVG